MPNNLVFNNVASQLLTQVYGYDGTNVQAIKTDGSGRLEVVGTITAIVGTFTAVVTPTFISSMIELDNVSGQGAAMTIDTSLLNTYTYMVRNLGTNGFTVKLQVSPVNSPEYFTDDGGGEFFVGSGTEANVLLVPKFFMQYTRILYDANSESITAQIWFNGRGL